MGRECLLPVLWRRKFIFCKTALCACPQCGGVMKKTLAAPSVHYKGTGWARKDRAEGGRTSHTAAKESGSSSGEAAGTDSAPSSDSAPAPATSAAPAPSKEPD